MFTEIYQGLLENIKKNIFSLDTLDLRSYGITDADVPILAEALKHNSHIRRVILANNSITGTSVAAFSHLNNGNACKITSLDLSGNSEIGNRGLKHLVRGGFKELVLDNIPIGNEGVKHLLGCPGLLILSIKNCDLTDEDAKLILTSKEIQKLDLGENNLTADAVENISKNSSLRMLYLDHNPIGDVGAEHVAGNSSIMLLSMDDCEISSKGLAGIAKGLTALVELYLTENKITDEGAEALAAHRKLKKVSLFKNKIGSKGALALLGSRLNDIDLAYNKIDYEKVQAEAERVVDHGKAHVSLQGNINTSMLKAYNPVASRISLNVFDSENGVTPTVTIMNGMKH